MRIPEIRDELSEIASRLLVLVKELERRRGPKAPRNSAPMTPKLAASVRAYKRANPDATQVDIGRHFNINQGRVSEALRGKRK